MHNKITSTLKKKVMVIESTTVDEFAQTPFCLWFHVAKTAVFYEVKPYFIIPTN